ncbi:9096_t:CDS:2, partial [Acaulospora morrowiae]
DDDPFRRRASLEGSFWYFFYRHIFDEWTIACLIQFVVCIAGTRSSYAIRFGPVELGRKYHGDSDLHASAYVAAHALHQDSLIIKPIIISRSAFVPSTTRSSMYECRCDHSEWEATISRELASKDRMFKITMIIFKVHAKIYDDLPQRGHVVNSYEAVVGLCKKPYSTCAQGLLLGERTGPSLGWGASSLGWMVDVEQTYKEISIFLRDDHFFS